MKKICLFAIIFLLFASVCCLAETQIKAEVDRLKVSTDETLTYKIVITTSDKDIVEPSLPSFNGFEVLSSAQSSTVSFLKNDLKTVLVYAFILVPKEPGKFKIGPATLKMKNDIISSEIFEIEVLQGKIKPKLPQEKKSPGQDIDIPGLGAPQITL